MANIVVTTSNLDVTVGEATSNIVVTDASSNVFVTNVSSFVANVTVSSTDTNVNVSQSAVISNAAVRSRISTRSIYNSVGGSETLDGPSGYLEYDEANGVVKLYQTRFHSNMFNENITGDKNYEVSLDTGYLNSTSNTWLSTKTTTDLAEGTNEYYTQARFDSALAGKSTTNLTEGTNKYYTNARVQAYVVDAGLDYNAEKVLNGITAGNVTLKQYQETYYDAGDVSGAVTLDVANGTMQRITLTGDVTGISLTNIQAGGHMTILATQDSTGNKNLVNVSTWQNYQWAGDFTQLTQSQNSDSVITIQYDGTTYSASLVRFDAYNTFTGKTTDDLTEGSSNLYFTNARANAVIATNTTDDLTEGTTNLYYTDARTDSAIDDYTGNIDNVNSISASELTANSFILKNNELSINNDQDYNQAGRFVYRSEEDNTGKHISKKAGGDTLGGKTEQPTFSTTVKKIGSYSANLSIVNGEQPSIAINSPSETLADKYQLPRLLGSSVPYEIIPNRQNSTVEGWFMWNDNGEQNSGDFRIAWSIEGNYGNSTDPNSSAWLGLQPSGAGQIIRFNGPSNVELQNAAYQVAYGTWYHVAITYNFDNPATYSGTYTMYINGTAVDSQSNGNTFLPNSYLRLGDSSIANGNNSPGSRETMDGYIDEFRVSESVRYNNNFTPQTSPFGDDEFTRLLLHFENDFVDTAEYDPKVIYDVEDSKWKFSNDGTSYQEIGSLSASTTDDLAEGSTNLYYTNARANSAIVTHFGDNTNSPFVVNGNLQVQGNIDYVNVEDLLVNDQSITMNFGNVAQDAMIIVDRVGSSSGANTEVRWNETTDKWTFTNDGSSYYNIATSTDDVAEGSSNLYYTDARSRNALSSTTASAAAGGGLAFDNTSGVFTFTPAYVADYITLTELSVTTGSPAGDGALVYDNATGIFTFTPADSNAAPVDSVNGQTGVVVLDTDNINEGTTNLYYTNARADARINLQTGPNLDLSGVTTSGLAEGTNEYYTQGRFDTAFNAKDTDDLSEGTTNLYFTTPRQRAGFTVTTGTPSGDGALAYDSATGVFAFTPADHPTDAVTSVNTQTGVVVLDTDDIAEGTAKYYATSLFNTDFATKTTTNLTEGTNLYYTQSRVRGDVDGETASATGTGSLVYDSATGMFTYTPPDISNKIELTNLSITQNSASGVGSLVYNNTTGVFTYTPPALPTGDITDVVAGVGLSGGGSSGAVTLTLDPTITTGTASGGGALAYNNATGVFTFAPADLSNKIALTDLSVTTIAASGDGALAYDNTSGIFTFTPADHPTDAVTSVNTQTGVVVLDTDDIAEGTNEYYTQARFNTAFSGKSTTDLTEGTNLYYTDTRSRAAVSTATASASGGGSLVYDSGTGVFTFAPAEVVSNAQVTAYIETNGLNASANIWSTENIIGNGMRTRTTAATGSYLWSGQLLNTYSGDQFGDSADGIYIEVDRPFQVTPSFGPQQVSFTGYTGNGATNLNGVDFWINGADMSGSKTVYKIFSESTGTTQASISATGITVTNGAGPTNGVVNGRYWSAGNHDVLFGYQPGVFTMGDDLGEFLRMDSANTTSQQGQFEFIRPMKMTNGMEITNQPLISEGQYIYAESQAGTDIDETGVGFAATNGRALLEIFNNAAPALNKENGLTLQQAGNQANSMFSVPRVATIKFSEGKQATAKFGSTGTNFNDVSAAMPDGSWSRADDSKIIRRRDYDYLLNGVYYPVATGAAQHTVASTVYKTSDTSTYVRAALPTGAGSPYYTNAMISQGIVAFRTMQPAVAAQVQNGFPYNVGTDGAESTVMFIDDKFNIGNEDDATKAYSFPKTPGANNTVLVMDTNNDLQFVDFQAKMDEHFENLLRKYIGTINLINPEPGGAALYTQAYIDMFGGFANTTVFSNNIDGGNA